MIPFGEINQYRKRITYNYQVNYWRLLQNYKRFAKDVKHRIYNDKITEEQAIQMLRDIHETPIWAYAKDELIGVNQKEMQEDLEHEESRVRQAKERIKKAEERKAMLKKESKQERHNRKIQERKERRHL